LYRVFFDQGDVFFIQLGGQSFGMMLAAQFGALGMLIYAPLLRKSRAKLDARIKELDTQPPKTQLAAGKHNFRAAVSDIESSTLQTPSTLGGHGRHFGRWVLQLRGQKPTTLQLETEDDMRRAFETLPHAISKHVNQVSWDAAKSKFTKIS
jgi:hypothetical protein